MLHIGSFPQYFARICWNSKNWVFPSGEAKELETGSYVTKAGFGHEEWLFNFAWLINGYHYAFLQPVGNSIDKVKGKSLEILLYSVNPNRDRVYVGEIKGCLVVEDEEAAAALRHYKKYGWLKSMKDQITAVGGDGSRLAGGSLFNVRFRPSDVEFYEPLRVAKPNDFVNKLKRYKLTAADKRVVDKQWRRRKGTRTPPSVQTITRSGQPGVVYDPIHAAMQGELFELLKKRFGSESVILEANCVDITIFGETRTILIEIKSDGDAKVAIRKALGQILEYAYCNSDSQQRDLGLVIVAPGLVTPTVSKYLDRLNKTFGIPLTYCSFSLGDKLPSGLSDSLTKSMVTVRSPDADDENSNWLHPKEDCE